MLTTLERTAQIIVGLAFAATLAIILALAWSSGAGATQEPFACTVEDDADAVFKHAVAEARFQSMPAWAHRHKGFRGDISDGVEVTLSGISDVEPGYIYTQTKTISSEAEYNRALSFHNGAAFLNAAAHTLVLPNGNETAIDGEYGYSVLRANAGANVRYWYYAGLEPTDDSIWCYEIRGRGHPPTPTPTPDPTE